MGCFRPVHVKAACARKRRVLLSARDTLVRRTRDLANAVRGLLRSFGLRPPRLLRERWNDAVRRLIAAKPMLMAAINPILAARDKLAEELTNLESGSAIRSATTPFAAAFRRIQVSAPSRHSATSRPSMTRRTSPRRGACGLHLASPQAATNPVRRTGQVLSPPAGMPERVSPCSLLA